MGVPGRGKPRRRKVAARPCVSTTVLDGGIGLGQGRASDTSTSVSIHRRIVLSDLGPHHMYGTCGVWYM